MNYSQGWRTYCIREKLTQPLFILYQSLTCGTGFYSSKMHETVWKGRKLVLRDKETGESIYETLWLVESHTHYELLKTLIKMLHTL